MTTNRVMRASDGERECAVEELRDAYAVGRLSLDEFDERATAAYTAKTWGELDDLTADLPAGQGPGVRRERPGPGSRYEAELRGGPRRALPPLWVIGIVCLVAAIAGHVLTGAIAVVFLTLSMLRAM